MRNASSALRDARTKRSAETERIQYEQEYSTHDVRNTALLLEIWKEESGSESWKKASLAAG